MKKEEILKKAIKRAVNNGLPLPVPPEALSNTSHNSTMAFYLQYPEVLIFDHKFAKAFFGKEDTPEAYHVTEGKIKRDLFHYYNYLPAWQAHLRRMVLEEDPILYLEKFL